MANPLNAFPRKRLPKVLEVRPVFRTAAHLTGRKSRAVKDVLNRKNVSCPIPEPSHSYSSYSVQRSGAVLADADRFTRIELRPALQCGESKVASLFGLPSRRLRAGQTLFKPESEHLWVYRLQTGWLARLRTLPDGRNLYTSLLLPGDLFGVDGMFVNRHADAIVALSDAGVQQVDHRELRHACETDADVAARCTWQVIEETRRLDSRIVSLGRGSAQERLAALILELRERLIISDTIVSDAREFSLPMIQTQLGDYLGLSAVHTNRVLKTMRDDGIVTVRSKQVIVHDLDACVRLAAPILGSKALTNRTIRESAASMVEL